MLEGIAIRWRLALLSAGLTLVILSAFAVVIGQVTSSRVRSDFNNELAAAVDNLSDRVTLVCDIPAGKCAPGGPDLRDFSAAGNATIRILWPDGRILDRTPGAPNFGLIFPTRHTEYDGLRVEVRKRPVKVVDPDGHHSPVVVQMVLQYGRKVSDIEATIRRIRLFLSGGVLAGTLLALLGGVLLGRRAMLPVARMTTAARDIQRTRDPSKTIPQPAADDEVAELARTLQAMLDSLEAAQEETEGALQRQREFVADASHELRTPLTSILANLELLTDVLDGERGEAASSALRSSQRMRRLVGDLLLLARADANRQLPHEPTDVSHVLVEVAAELGPVSDGHHLTVDADDAVVDGTRDELYRMTLNLVENAIRHTPEGHAHPGHGAPRQRRGRARRAGRRAGRGPRAARPHLRALRPRRGRPRLVQRARALDRARGGRVARRQRRARGRPPGRALRRAPARRADVPAREPDAASPSPAPARR